MRKSFLHIPYSRPTLLNCFGLHIKTVKKNNKIKNKGVIS